MNPYKVLGLSQQASKEEIQQAFKKLAKKLHPDRNKDPNAQQQFQEMTEAFQKLQEADFKPQDYSHRQSYNQSQKQQQNEQGQSKSSYYNSSKYQNDAPWNQNKTNYEYKGQKQNYDEYMKQQKQQNDYYKKYYGGAQQNNVWNQNDGGQKQQQYYNNNRIQGFWLDYYLYTAEVITFIILTVALIQVFRQQPRRNTLVHSEKMQQELAKELQESFRRDREPSPEMANFINSKSFSKFRDKKQKKQQLQNEVHETDTTKVQNDSYEQLQDFKTDQLGEEQGNLNDQALNQNYDETQK